MSKKVRNTVQTVALTIVVYTLVVYQAALLAQLLALLLKVGLALGVVAALLLVLKKNCLERITVFVIRNWFDFIDCVRGAIAERSGGKGGYSDRNPQD